MQKELAKLRRQAADSIEAAADLAQLEKIETEYFGRKEGKLNLILKGLIELSAEEKKSVGEAANELKNELAAKIEIKKNALKRGAVAAEIEKEKIDLTLPVWKEELGTIHPSAQIHYELEDIF